MYDGCLSDVQGDSLESRLEFSVVTPVRMKQSEPKKYAIYLDVCVIDCVTYGAGSDQPHFASNFTLDVCLQIFHSACSHQVYLKGRSLVLPFSKSL